MQPQHEYLQPMSRAPTQPPRLPPKERAWVDLFNAVHTLEALYLRVDFAAVLPRRHPALPPEREGERNAAFSWPGKRYPYLVPIEDLLADQGRLMKTLLARLHKDDVALAVPHLPQELWRFLHEHGYYREVDSRQHEGWFADSEEEARERMARRPRVEPRIALLPPQGREGLIGEECLLLAQVSYQWEVLPEIGIYGRPGGNALLEGDQVCFVSSSPRWEGYKVRLKRWIDAKEVGALWGATAQERAAEDSRSPVVTVEVWEAGREHLESGTQQGA